MYFDFAFDQNTPGIFVLTSLRSRRGVTAVALADDDDDDDDKIVDADVL
jgi:hypothetical protein